MTNIKKINWFKRIFTSWTTLENHFKISDHGSEELIQLRAQKELIEKSNNDLLKNIDDLRTSLNDKSAKIIEQKEELIKLKSQNQMNTEEMQKYDQIISDNNNRRMELETRLQERTNEKEKLDQDIQNKLQTLSKIEKTFFGSSGNKGKGVLGEMQLKTYLEKSDLPHEFWVENLQVGSNNVEFAIKAGEDGKWIPIDSKVLDVTIEDGKFIIDDYFLKNVETQAKKITKYLGTTKTSDYGLLVLQSDELYMELFNYNPAFFNRMIQDLKIYIMSPSSFIQFAWSISNILEIYAKVNKDTKLYKEMISLIDSVNKFSVNIKKSYQTLKVAIETHYPTIEKKQNRIVPKLDNKIDLLPDLNSSKSKKTHDEVFVIEDN